MVCLFDDVVATQSYQPIIILGLKTYGNEYIITVETYFALNLHIFFKFSFWSGQTCKELFVEKDRPINDTVRVVPQDNGHEKEMLLTVT